MKIKNLTHSNKPLQDGDFVEYIHDNGKKVRKHYYAPIESEPAPITTLTSVELWDRFTEAEKENLLDSPNKKIKKFLYELRLRSEINLNDSKVIDAINALESAGLIEAGRAEIILKMEK